MREDLENQINEARKKSILSDKPDYNFVYNVYEEIVRNALRNG